MLLWDLTTALSGDKNMVWVICGIVAVYLVLVGLAAYFSTRDYNGCM